MLASKSLSRRDRKRLQTLNHLASAAMRLFERDGFKAVTMERIAAEADVAKGTLYNHFPTKEAQPATTTSSMCMRSSSATVSALASYVRISNRNISLCSFITFVWARCSDGCLREILNCARSSMRQWSCLFMEPPFRRPQLRASTGGKYEACCPDLRYGGRYPADGSGLPCANGCRPRRDFTGRRRNVRQR